MNWKFAAATLALVATFATAQTIQTTWPKFEVASIRPDSPPDAFAGEFKTELPGSRLTVRQIVLRKFIENACDIRPFELSGGPGWINSQGYDIEAMAEGGLTKQQMRLMMQALLEERFQLKVHRERRNLPVYDVVVASSGSKLQESNSSGCEPPSAPVARSPQFEEGQPPSVPCGRAVQITTPAGARMQGHTILMPEMVGLLTTVLGWPVIDKTGFTRAFDFNLEFAVDSVLAGLHASPSDPVAPSDPANAPSILTAIQQQLGLKLQPAKGPVEVVVIDRVARPTAN